MPIGNTWFQADEPHYCLQRLISVTRVLSCTVISMMLNPSRQIPCRIARRLKMKTETRERALLHPDTVFRWLEMPIPFFNCVADSPNAWRRLVNLLIGPLSH